MMQQTHTAMSFKMHYTVKKGHQVSPFLSHLLNTVQLKKRFKLLAFFKAEGLNVIYGK